MIGKNILEIRKQRGLTLSEVAERACIAKSYLSNIERNINKNPSIHVIRKIALVLEVDVETLLKTEKTKGSKKIDAEWIEFFSELKEAGIEKQQIQEFKTLLEFIKWRQELSDSDHGKSQ
ncbi:helix-turn-helix transcriptional regulator [Bacillaceae bacterium Marseille-Q3522]|nr:helix-turn-helix transcriptional regulator [Bacillaceae bacterium Marseille-Q3522]